MSMNLKKVKDELEDVMNMIGIKKNNVLLSNNDAMNMLLDRLTEEEQETIGEFVNMN
jgi:hypothetical protein